MNKTKEPCQCEFCKPCSFCGHKADEHMCGDGQCFKCPCPSYDNKDESKTLEDFAEIDLGLDKL